MARLVWSGGSCRYAQRIVGHTLRCWERAAARFGGSNTDIAPRREGSSGRNPPLPPLHRGRRHCDHRLFFGIGFFLLAQSTEAMNSNAGIGELGSFANRLPRILSNASSNYGDTASVSIEPQIPRSSATATLPAVPLAPPMGQPSPVGSVPASDAKDPSFGKGAPGSEVPEASPPASTPEPAPTSLAAAPAPEEASRLSAAQVTELLSRGDSFLHAGDVASARLFYERAADAATGRRRYAWGQPSILRFSPEPACARAAIRP